MGCHAVALYDATRLYIRSVSSFGIGTYNVALEFDLKGFDWVRFLPKAMGESCSTKAYLREKVDRANKRRHEALAAIERERARRETSDEEKERLRKEKMELMQRERDIEEKVMFDTAYLCLKDYRESSVPKSRNELPIIVQKWIDLHKVKEARYPYTLKSAICHSNSAIVLLEVETDNEAQAQREASSLAIKCINATMEVLYSEYPIREIVEDINFDAGFNGICFERHLLPIYIILLQNSLSILKLVDDLATLNEQNDVVVTLAFLWELLPPKLKDNIQAERKIFDMVILPMGDVLSGLTETLMEFTQLKEIEIKRREIERQMQLEAELKAASILQVETPEETLRRLRREKELARLDRRRQRQSMINSRKKLYAMIQSDEISTLFRMKARSVAKSFGENDPDLKDPFDFD